jgi:hypothetical protein
MSLRAFSGSIANPAQSGINMGANSLSNATNIGATGAFTGGQLNLTNTAFSQTINFSSTNPSATNTGFVSYSAFQDVLSVDANMSEFNGQIRINDATTHALNLIGAGGTGMYVVGASGGAYPNVRYSTFNGSGNQGLQTFNTDNNEMEFHNDVMVQKADANAKIRLFTNDFGKPLVIDYNTSNGTRIGAPLDRNSTYIFGPAGATVGATAAIPYLKVDGASGEGRVYDTVYNPVPSVQTYGQFSLNATFNIGSTGGTAAGVADTATQISLDTDVISEGCSLSSGGISVAAAGKYNITVSPQFFNTGSGNHNVYFWFRVNSTDVANSATGIYLQGNNAQQVPTVSVVLDLAANDVVKIMAAADDNEIQCLNVGAISSPYSRPAAPAIIATIVRAA